MALSVKDVSELQLYILGVLKRADHHATNVDEIILTLTGAIVWRKDDAPIKVMAHNGDTKNVLWVEIGGTRYAFSYNHENEEIELRKGSTHGEIISRFNNNSSVSDIKRVFNNL